MKAVRVNAWSQPLQVEEIPQPSPASDEVLVRVHAASINPFDTFVHAGYMQGFLTTPLTLGTDFAGEVVQTGSEVSHVKLGDAVYGLTPMHPGTFAEFVVAKANEVTHKPKTLNYIQAAAVPLASLAAYQSLYDLGQAQKGDRILILGAGGAVGGGALQMALDSGAVVFAVDIPDKAEFIHDLGHAQFINAITERFEDVVGTVDLVLDFVGGENLERSYNVLQPGGRYVTSLVYPVPQEEAVKRGIRAEGLATQAKADQLDGIAHRIDSGRFKVFINCTYPLYEAQTAMEFRQKSTKPGKIVLTML